MDKGRINTEYSNQDREKRKNKIKRAQEVKRQKFILGAGALGVAFVVILVAVIAKATGGTTDVSKANSQKTSADKSLEEAPITENNNDQVCFLAAGDNIGHDNIVAYGLTGSGTYNFDGLYKNIAEEVRSADIAVVNQETIFVENQDNISGYPEFGTPKEMGDALVYTGFDVVLHASNHSYDKGSTGITDTINYWKNTHPDIAFLGIHDSEESASQLCVIEKNNIRIAMLDYTYGLNNEMVPDEPYMIDFLEEEKVAADVQNAKNQSDCVVVFMHAGIEDQHQPSDYEKYWMNYLLGLGVDVTIASHSHVLSPCEMLTDDNGNQMLAYYSLGN